MDEKGWGLAVEETLISIGMGELVGTWVAVEIGTCFGFGPVLGVGVGGVGGGGWLWVPPHAPPPSPPARQALGGGGGSAQPIRG